MKRLLPYPLLWALLLALWLLLNETLGIGHVLLGGVLALLACLSFALLQPPRTRTGARAVRRRIAGAMRLAWRVQGEIVRSNLAVARIVLNPGNRHRTSAFLDIPLRLRDPAGLAVLACIITATPGTAWARYDAARGVLTMHILDLIDEEAMLRIIQDRYEGPLMEIFE